METLSINSTPTFLKKSLISHRHLVICRQFHFPVSFVSVNYRFRNLLSCPSTLFKDNSDVIADSNLGKFVFLRYPFSSIRLLGIMAIDDRLKMHSNPRCLSFFLFPHFFFFPLSIRPSIITEITQVLYLHLRHGTRQITLSSPPQMLKPIFVAVAKMKGKKKPSFARLSLR